MRSLLYQGDGPRSVWAHLRVTFPAGFGWPCFALGGLGIVRALWQRRMVDLVMLAFAFPFFVIVASTRWSFPRYLIPLIPVFAVFAGETTRWLLAELSLPPRMKPLAAIVAATVLASPGLKRTIEFDRVASRTDTRVLASEWVSENLPKRSEVLVCRGFGAPTINTDRRRPPAFEPRLIDCTPESVRSDRSPVSHYPRASQVGQLLAPERRHEDVSGPRRARDRGLRSFRVRQPVRRT